MSAPSINSAMHEGPVEANAANAPWGLYDTVDRCWIGNADGPAVYDGVEVPFELARVFEAVANDRMGFTTRRLLLCAYDGSGTSLRDEIPTLRTTEESLAYLERGTGSRRSGSSRRQRAAE